jgi:hypothetical protein
LYGRPVYSNLLKEACKYLILTIQLALLPAPLIDSGPEHILRRSYPKADERRLSERPGFAYLFVK